ncbi:MAG TPA: beta-ketoacyl-[acyl-carrier-protein] synthase family protein [Chitinophagaceae bacterium]|nr:beta-ketoacyl-[acyl-carrier-protein] synthase family protein [Chitinophagaceae bacterium]
MRICVTGMGIITSIGKNVEENLFSLSKAQGGITRIEGLKNIRKSFLGGQIKLTDAELKFQLKLSDNASAHRSTLLGLIAAKEAWGESMHRPKIRTGLIFGTTIGGININDNLFSKHSLIEPDAKFDYFIMHDDSFGTDFIADTIGITNFKATVSTACSTAANSIQLGARLIRANKLDRVLVGGGEAITNYTLNGFDSLMLYDQEVCRPFDENRKGLNLGEAGCFLLLESERCVSLSKRTIIAELNGWGNACDAYHQTASSPEGTGAVVAIKEALKIAQMTPESIDVINAHGTGTPNNDLSEMAAMSSVFDDKIPRFSSTKSYIGHTLAAAGGVEAIYSILSIKHGMIFPNLHFETPMKEFHRPPEHKLVVDKDLNVALSNSFGFGGNCTELIFSK